MVGRKDDGIIDESFDELCRQAKACRLCQGRYFDHDPRPVFLAQPSAKLMIVGQAPGRRVHLTGLPFNDISGDTLRDWMGITREQFYDPARIAIIPAALCFPGTEPLKGDLPPPPVCAPTWHPRFLNFIQPALTLLVGRYAQAYYLNSKETVTEVVARWPDYLADSFFPLPHPSPRNRKWLKDRPWFDGEVLPALREQVSRNLTVQNGA